MENTTWKPGHILDSCRHWFAASAIFLVETQWRAQEVQVVATDVTHVNAGDTGKITSVNYNDNHVPADSTFNIQIDRLEE